MATKAVKRFINKIIWTIIVFIIPFYLSASYHYRTTMERIDAGYFATDAIFWNQFSYVVFFAVTLAVTTLLIAIWVYPFKKKLPKR